MRRGQRVDPDRIVLHAPQCPLVYVRAFRSRLANLGRGIVWRVCRNVDTCEICCHHRTVFEGFKAHLHAIGSSVPPTCSLTVSSLLGFHGYLLFVEMTELVCLPHLAKRHPQADRTRVLDFPCGPAVLCASSEVAQGVRPQPKT